MSASQTETRLQDDENQRRVWLASRPGSVLQIDQDPEAGPEYGAIHQALSTYVEEFWTPIIGPTAMTIYRRLATWVDLEGPGPVPLRDLGLSLGLRGEGNKGSPTSPHSVLIRSLDRLCRTRHCRIDPDREVYLVRLWMPPLGVSMRAKLPQVLRECHPSPWAPTLGRSV